MSACKLHSTEEAVLDIPPFQHGRGVCVPGTGRRRSAQCAGVGWSIGLGRLAIGRLVYVLWLSLSRAGTGARVVLKVRSLRQEHIYCKDTPTFCSAFGRADVAVAVVATRGNGLRLLLVRRIARAVRRACCGRLKEVPYCSWASNQVRRPAEFKHITKRRKRN